MQVGEGVVGSGVVADDRAPNWGSEVPLAATELCHGLQIASGPRQERSHLVVEALTHVPPRGAREEEEIGECFEAVWAVVWPQRRDGIQQLVEITVAQQPMELVEPLLRECHRADFRSAGRLCLRSTPGWLPSCS